MKNIKALKNINKQLHITLLLPQKLKSIEGLKDVEQRFYQIPTNNNIKASRFNNSILADKLKWVF